MTSSRIRHRSVGTPAAERKAAKELATVLSPEDRQALALAHAHLEHPSLAARLTSVVGTPIEIGLQLLPRDWYKGLHSVAERAIEKALDAAISSLRLGPETSAHDGFYKALSMGAGAVGGFFGLPALLIELPISTTLMLRSIADIARSQGESLDSLDTRLACMQVFALGGRVEEDDAADTGYYGVRVALALPVFNASRYLARQSLTQEGGPALVSFISVISSRFGVAVSEKAAAQLIPLIGAAGGATVNAIFMQHFQDMAHSHFTMRRLERRYGAGVVKAAYQGLP